MFDIKSEVGIYKSATRNDDMYEDIEISEKQIKACQVKDAKIALKETRIKNGL
ncbi:MAG: hypothetical protein MRZ75_11120 [Roseburia sp.]|uniref:hypothetical protein n=1 Tax=Roseburia sp. 831b TaxID=1261635 RepID=UPI001356337B|nr:hypothetical protein [Roseburia sp. 831b]MCI5919861.1 hypothetical protein [Roseburia sp.]WVK71795.1 hypothetical protein BIV16_08265 [Roseburia sp. 831b]